MLTARHRQRESVRERHRYLQRTREAACRSDIQLVWLTFFLIVHASNTLVRHSTRLAEILRHQATLLEHIITDQRYYPDYFRVAFFGEFPDAIRGKQFIVRLYAPFSFRFTHSVPGDPVPRLRVGKVWNIL